MARIKKDLPGKRTERGLPGKRKCRTAKAVLLAGIFGLGLMLLAALQPVTYGMAAEETEDRSAAEKVFVPSTVEGPVFAQEAGFYNTAFTLTISAPAGSRVYYTLDGSLPVVGGAATKEYSDGIGIHSYTDKIPFRATVVRAIAVNAAGECSDVVTNTYFVARGMEKRFKTAVISISAPEEAFYDVETGILTNAEESGREWEREAHFEYFTAEGKQEISMNVGVRVHGAYSRRFAIKSLRLYARDEYDTQKNFKYDFFSDSIIPAVEMNGKEKTIKKFKRLILRTGGNEGDAWETTFFRDALVQSLMTGTSLDLQGYTPTITFLNGKFYGILNIRERMDDRYLSSHYNCSEEDVVIYDFQYTKDSDGKVILPKSGEAFETVIYEGPEEQLSYFQKAYSFVTGNDMSVAENYRKAQSYFDIDNFIDYLCVELYSGNTDWPHNNCRAWRYFGEASEEYGLDGKIRWLLFDTDFGFGLYGHQADEDTLAPMLSDKYSVQPYRDVLTRLLRSFMKNASFQEKFVSRYVDLLNSRFSPEEILDKIDALEKVYEPLVQEQYSQYGQKGNYADNVEQVRAFARTRNRELLLKLSKQFPLGGRYTISVKSSEALHGTILLNTAEISEDCLENGVWSGTYFKNLPMTVTAVAAEGYAFDYWEGASVAKGVNTITFAAGEIGTNMTLIPHFVKTAGDTAEDGKQPEGGKQPEDGKNPEDGKQPEDGKKPDGEKEPGTADAPDKTAPEQTPSDKTGSDAAENGQDASAPVIEIREEENTTQRFPIGAVLIAVVLILGGGLAAVLLGKKK